MVTRTGERLWEAELYRLKGLFLLESSSSENAIQAESNFHKAIEISRNHNNKGWELRASTNLAKHLADQNKTQEARQLLAPVYDWFTEGFETVDHKSAKQLLNNLA